MLRIYSIVFDILIKVLKDLPTSNPIKDLSEDESLRNMGGASKTFLLLFLGVGGDMRGFTRGRR